MTVAARGPFGFGRPSAVLGQVLCISSPGTYGGDMSRGEISGFDILNGTKI